MARADPADATDASGALNLGKIFKTVAGILLKREEELMARADPTDESAALNLGKIFKTVAGILLRREDELMARAEPTDESAALNVGKIIHGVATAAGVFNSLFGREELEILARADVPPTDESGALNLGKIIKTVAGFLLKREEMELARRADPTDESGALNVGKIVHAAAGVLNTLFGREELELMARADPEDEAGALNLGKIVHTAAGVLNTLFGRDEIELMARADPAEVPTDESGALNLGKIIKTVAGFILKREDQLMAREPLRPIRSPLRFGTPRHGVSTFIARDVAPAPTADESAALNLGKIFKTVAGFLLKREDELMAREPFNPASLRFLNKFPVRPVIARDDFEMRYVPSYSHLHNLASNFFLSSRSLNELD